MFLVMLYLYNKSNLLCYCWLNHAKIVHTKFMGKLLSDQPHFLCILIHMLLHGIERATWDIVSESAVGYYCRLTDYVPED